MKNKNNPQFSSIDSKPTPVFFDDVTDTESFVSPLLQGLHFIQRITFVGVDAEVDKAIDAHFSKRPIKTKKLLRV
ncbi:MAG: hypothetical protein JW913_20880 [Chitinispirillaceae bacterium]|nr:hypothetical protein [Chitinispirillaceae bacterium]